MRIERAGVDHAGVIAELNQHVHRLHVEAEPDQFRDLTPQAAEPVFASMLQDGDPVVFLAARGGAWVAYIWAEEVQRPENPFTRPAPTMYVHHIAVAPEARRSGVGRALVEAVEEEARVRGVTSLGVDHWTFNDEAARFFRDLGFEPYNVRLRRDLGR